MPDEPCETIFAVSDTSAEASYRIACKAQIKGGCFPFVVATSARRIALFESIRLIFDPES